MQNKELNFVVQKIVGLMRIRGKFFPKWKDLEFHPCGLRQKHLYSAELKAKESLKKQRETTGTYRIIKRYIPIPENDLQLHFNFTWKEKRNAKDIPN